MSKATMDDGAEDRKPKRRKRRTRGSIFTDLVVNTHVIPIDSMRLNWLFCRPPDRVKVTLILAWYMWITQKPLPDTLDGWSSSEIRRTFAMCDARVIRKFYTPEVLAEVDDLVARRRPPIWTYPTSAPARLN